MPNNITKEANVAYHIQLVENGVVLGKTTVVEQSGQRFQTQRTFIFKELKEAVEEIAKDVV